MQDATETRTGGTSAAADVELDAVIVGAGFAGLYMLHRLRGQGLNARVIEAAGGVGGTWYWNRYPGARCDVESMEYSYQFSEDLQQEWTWSERYSAQPEILRYINHVADRFDLRRDVQLNTRVETATFDEARNLWLIETSDGRRLRARYCIMATGCLSSPNTPDVEGLDSFKGEVYHTGKWPHEGVDFTGKRVGVIGTGSSAIQSIPLIAEQAAQLYVFQRTANYSVPAHNGPLDRAAEARIKGEYSEFRARNNLKPFIIDIDMSETPALAVSEEERRQVYQAGWDRGGFGFMGGFGDLLFDKEANDTAASFVRGKIHEIVKDPALAELLSPGHVLGCKRLCFDTGYFETFNRANVTLVDVRAAPIAAITPTGLRTATQSYDFDALVFATGFDAMTGALQRIDITGRGGVTLKDAWAAGPRTFLGLSTVGFPNFFIISGPGSPSVLTNMLPSIEQHVNWIAACVGYMKERQLAAIEPTLQAQDEWVEHVNAVAGATLYPTCNSWYLGANVPGKPRVFMPYVGFPPYVEKCKEVAASGYAGFVLRAGG